MKQLKVYVRKDGFYLPDFLIKLNGKQILIEVKGNFYRQDVPDYIANKIAAGIKYAKEKGYQFILTFDKPDKEYKFIENAFINENK